jgi:hypothetical protein
MRWAGHVVCVREIQREENYYKFESERPFWRPWKRWEQNNNMDYKGSGLLGCGLNLSVSGLSPVVNSNEPLGSVKDGISGLGEVLKKNCSVCN